MMIKIIFAANYENQNKFLCVKFLIQFLKLFAETLLLVLSPLLFLREFNSGFSSPIMGGVDTLISYCCI